jgi:hypothetical protein
LHAKALDEQSRSGGGCNPDTGFCDSNAGLEANRDARAAGNLATAFFIGGGALVAGGVTLFLVGNADESSSASLRLLPFAARSGFGAAVHGRF